MLVRRREVVTPTWSVPAMTCPVGAACAEHVAVEVPIQVSPLPVRGATNVGYAAPFRPSLPEKARVHIPVPSKQPWDPPYSCQVGLEVHVEPMVIFFTSGVPQVRPVNASHMDVCAPRPRHCGKCRSLDLGTSVYG